MKVKELKKFLDKVPDNSEILLNVCGHYLFDSEYSHGEPQIYYIKIGKQPVFCFSADRFFNPKKLNYSGVKVVEHLFGCENSENGYDDEDEEDDDY